MIAPDSVPATLTETIASAPAAKAASKASLNSPGDAAAVFGNGASGATIRSQKVADDISTPALYVSEPKVTSSGTIEIPSAAARAGSRSDAESVKIATRLKRRSSSG
ncbi:MAG TPA: hypothetical protein VIM25_08065 [Candidatus Limnocylindrales bacterium]